MIFEVNNKSIPHSSQRPVGRIKERVRGKVIPWLQPFSLEHSPKNLGYVQMWGIWWQKENMQSSFLPQFAKCEQFLSPMYRSIVKYDDRLPVNAQRETVQEANHCISINAFRGCEPMHPAIAVNHGEAIESCATLGWNVNVLFGEFPSVWNVGILTEMGLVSVIKVYGAVVPQLFKLLQLPNLILVELRRGFPLRTFPYTSKSCANALKKRLRVSSQAVFPVAASHCALAVRTLDRSFSMACRMISSSCLPIIGLRPRPGRVSRPLRPSAKKRITQLLTETWCISNCSPICGELKPCAFNRTALQRIRNACEEPWRYPFSNAFCCIGVNSIFVILPIWIKVSYIDTTDF